MKKYESSKSLMNRQVASYLHPKLFKLFHADKLNHFQHTTSKHVQFIIEKYFGEMTESRRQQLLEEYHTKVMKKKYNP